MTAVIFPTRVMQALGAITFIVTNAAGGLNPDFRPGDVMLISDHINMMGTNALIGPNEESLGPRFPDMTHTYTPELQQLALQIAEKEQIDLQHCPMYAVPLGMPYVNQREVFDGRRLQRSTKAHPTGIR